MSDPTYKIPFSEALRLADEFDAMTVEQKERYPEMEPLALHLQREALLYGQALICIRDEDCVPYPGASDMCAAGTVFTDVHDREVIRG